MRRDVAEEDDWENDDEGWEGPDQDEDEEDTTIPCPYCGESIHEDAQRCPYCENYLSEEDTPAEAKPWWIIVGALLCMYVIYRWIVG
jgi:predicted nucleic acid-binding Zn ribbon protein